MIRSRKTLCVALAAMLATAGASVGYACFMRSPQPVTVWLDHIEVDIKDQVAVKTYDCTFKNPNPGAVVGGVCYMELEPGAQVDNMSVLVDGKEMKAEILDVEKAKTVFNDIVKNGGSPALLEYYGNQLIQTQVPRIAPNSTVKVKLTYTTVLQKKGDVVRLQMLNTNPKAQMQPLASASVKVRITSKDPIKNVYSPTHKIKIVEAPNCDVAVEWSAENYMPKHPFVLYYQVSDDPVGASVVAHRELGEQGTFMMMLSPTIGSGAGAVTSKDIMPKDIVFCVDTSGSMLDGGKMDQARSALEYCLKNLRPGDRFNIVDFSTAVRSFADTGMVAIDDESRAKALNYAKKLAPRGGTAIKDALDKSLDLLGESDRMKMILFATDGLPTIGERDPEQILKTITKRNTKDVRMFVFGEGFDVNTKLLDFLALNNRGEADYILPEEDIAKKIAHFYDRVGSPIMTDLKIEFPGMKTDDVYPRQVPDLFNGEQVVVYGKFEGSGSQTVRLTATVAGSRKTFEYTLNFPEVSEDDKSAFVPRLWAGRKVDFLLNELRKSEKQDAELVKEVTALAKKFGIVTPYTSFLMAEDIVTGGGGALPPGGPMPVLQGRLQNAIQRERAATDAAAPAAAKAEAVKEAKKFAETRRGLGKSGGAAELDEAADREGGDGKPHGSLTTLRYVGSKTFYHGAEGWVESEFDPEKNKDLKTIEIGSDAYFDLLSKNADLAKYLALSEVTLKHKGVWYKFVLKK